MGKPEILSPAGSIDAMKAACNAGCDAVYMGGMRFGARAFADNPDNDGLTGAIDYMHAHGKKIYITVNTLCKEYEVDEVIDYLAFLYENGADAVIVQDMGIMSLSAAYFPTMAVHASTQMTLTTPEAVGLLPKTVSRIVPARELSLFEIERLKRFSGREVEVFVHGALCFSYSGQCLFSSMVGGRSGNRGRCAQPCRKLYYGGDGPEGRYLLSMKDLCGLSAIPKLCGAGVDSFKIEGRMKNPVYTAGVTDIYRRALDLYLTKREEYKAEEEIHEEYGESLGKMLLELYNRGGFTNGYFDMHNGPEMLSFERQNHNGIHLGEVADVTGKNALISLSEPANAGDVLEIRDGARTVFEFTVGAANEGASEFDLYCGRELPKAGNDIFRTRNAKLNRYITERFINKETKVPVSAELTLVEEERAVLEVSVSKEYTVNNEDLVVNVTGEIAQKAKKQPLTEERVKEQLEKSGDSCFAITNARVGICGDVFMAVSQINELRREGLSTLYDILTHRSKRGSADTERIRKNLEKYNLRPDAEKVCGEDTGNAALEPFISVRADNMEQLDEVLKIPEVSEVIIEAAKSIILNFDETVKKIKNAGKRAIIGLPYICRTQTFTYFSNHFTKTVFDSADGILVRTLDELFMLTDRFDTDPANIRLDYTLHNINNVSKAFYKKLGITKFTSSFELTKEELNELMMYDTEMVIYGRTPNMITAQCFAKNLYECANNGAGARKYLTVRDELGHEFVVKNECDHCYNVLRNEAVLALTDRKDEILKMNPRSVRFELTDEDPGEIAGIIGAYINGNRLKDVFPDRSFTQGAFKRSVE